MMMVSVVLRVSHVANPSVLCFPLARSDLTSSMSHDVARLRFKFKFENWETRRPDALTAVDVTSIPWLVIPSKNLACVHFSCSWMLKMHNR